MSNTNSISAAKAFGALRAYASYTDSYSLYEHGDARREEFERAIQHLLCDLQHLCEREGVSFEEANTEAQEHYKEEARDTY